MNVDGTRIQKKRVRVRKTAINDKYEGEGTMNKRKK